MPDEKALDRVIAHLNDHPGYYRPVLVAQRLGITTHQAATYLAYLADRGRITRVKMEPAEGKKRGHTLYGVDKEVGPTTSPRRNFYAAQREAAGE